MKNGICFIPYILLTTEVPQCSAKPGKAAAATGKNRTKPVTTAPRGGNGVRYVRKGRAGCNMAGAGKARAPNKCGWLKPRPTS